MKYEYDTIFHIKDFYSLLMVAADCEVGRNFFLLG